jgi:hypothetical protein
MITVRDSLVLSHAAGLGEGWLQMKSPAFSADGETETMGRFEYANR